MSWQTESFGPELATKEGLQSTESVLSNKKYIGIYFSAHWCPPCRGFTTILGKFYSDLIESGSSDFEVIFASWDNDEQSFKNYWESQPWKAVPYGSEIIKVCKTYYLKIYLICLV